MVIIYKMDYDPPDLHVTSSYASQNRKTSFLCWTTLSMLRHAGSPLASGMWFLLTWSWEMLKLDLTGQSSHVSFSRNIRSSSSRALRDKEKQWGKE